MNENYGIGELDEILDAEYTYFDSEADTPELNYDEGISVPSELYSSLQHYAEQVNQETVGMSDAEVEEYMEFAWGPIIGTLVSALAPVAINAVGGLISKIAKPRRPRRPSRPVQRPSRRLPARPAMASPPPAPSRPTVAPAGQLLSTLRSLGGGAIQQLASLLQNPNVVNAISNVATTGINAAVARNNTPATAPTTTPTARDTIDTIFHLTSEIMQNTADTDVAIPEYMYAQDGELLGDPYSPAERAAIVVAHLGT